MTTVLGVSCFFHDAAAVLVRDGHVVAAAEEERFTRRKHDARFPVNALRFCCGRAGIAPAEADAIAFYEQPLRKAGRSIRAVAEGAPRTRAAFEAMVHGWGEGRLFVRSEIVRQTGIRPDRIVFVDHHLSHAASAYLASPFDEAALLTVDGVGEYATATIGVGSARSGRREHRSPQLLLEQTFPHSVGLLYSAFTDFLGFDVNDGEYKVMGLAAYGEPVLQDQVREVVTVNGDGSVRLDMRYFEFQRSPSRTYSDRFERLFGAPRDGRVEFDPSGPTDRHYANVAASVQQVVGDIVVAMAREARRRTGMKDLAMAGGVALNGVANARVFHDAGFERIFVPPAPGDSGAAMGAALHVAMSAGGISKPWCLRRADLGQDFSDDAVLAAVRLAGLEATTYDDPEALCDAVAETLSQGSVVGWFQGRFEWGPRALGNRSILADPRSADMQDRINTKIKFREPFRPFAPAILSEAVPSYVAPAAHDAAMQQPASFMLFVLPLSEEGAAALPAADHFGTARIQNVNAASDSYFARLLGAFGQRTGVPALLNTSFNLRGEPIVRTPADAISTFRRSGLDQLVLGDHVVSKR